jgi:hypothetical protein
LRRHIAKAARITGEAGLVILLSVPITSMTGRKPLPPAAVGATVLVMLGTGIAAQMVAIPAELDASFRRALPLLRDGYIDDEQTRKVRKILAAASLTYISSSLVSVLNIWPWLGHRPAVHGLLPAAKQGDLKPGSAAGRQRTRVPHSPVRISNTRSVRRKPENSRAMLLRRYGKPVIRSWLRLSRCK